MKKIYLLLTVFLISYTAISVCPLGSGISIDSEISNCEYQLSQISVEQKVDKVLSAEEGIYRLPFSKEEIRQQIVPEINSERAILAPNYPQTVNVFGEEKRSLIRDWINNYPAEYDSYIAYIENYIRTNK